MGPLVEDKGTALVYPLLCKTQETREFNRRTEGITLLILSGLLCKLRYTVGALEDKAYSDYSLVAYRVSESFPHRLFSATAFGSPRWQSGEVAVFKGPDSRPTGKHFNRIFQVHIYL